MGFLLYLRGFRIQYTLWFWIDIFMVLQTFSTQQLKEIPPSHLGIGNLFLLLLLFVYYTCKKVRPSSRNNLKGTSVSRGFLRSDHPFWVRYCALVTAQTGVLTPEKFQKNYISSYIRSYFPKIIRGLFINNYLTWKINLSARVNDLTPQW